MIRNILFVSFLFVSTKLMAENAIVNLMGCQLETSEMGHAVLGDYCDRQSQWQTTTILPTQCRSDQKSQIQIDATNTDKNKFIQLKPVLPVNQPQMAQPMNGQGKQKAEADLIKQVEELLLNSAENIKPGEKLLLKVHAHGESDCLSFKVKNLDNQVDLGQGNQNLKNCQLSVMIRPEGDQQAISLPINQLVPILKKIKQKGVKVAVQLANCHSGAAVLDFASAGICAQAYSPADSLLTMCGGEDLQPEDKAGTADLSMIQSCRSLPDESIATFLKKANLSPDINECLFSTKKNNQGSVQNLKKINLKNPTISQMTAQFRKQDRTLNIPVGTDGPFWISQHFAFISTSPTMPDMPGKSFSTQQICDQDVEAYMNQLTDQIAKVTGQIFKQNCDMKPLIQKFITKHKKTFQQYYDEYKTLSQLKSVTHRQLINGVSKENKEKLAKNSYEQELDKYVQTSFDAIPAEVITADGMYKGPQGQVWTKDQVREELKKMMRTHIKQTDPNKAFESHLLNESSDFHPMAVQMVGKNKYDEMQKNLKKIPQQRERLVQVQKQHIMPLERQLYKEMQASKEFKTCMQLSPEFAEAQKTCEEFHMPGN